MAKAISVQITGEYNNRDVNRAIKDLELLKTSGANTTTAMGGLQRGMRSLMPSMAMLGLAAGAAAVAAAGMAVKFGVDSVKAFIEDDAAATKLATTLNNLGFKEATPEVEAMIDAQQRLTGIADTELRPAFDRLIRSTRDVEEASRLLILAQNIAIGTGNELSAVTAALSKAAVGSTTSLMKLGTGLTATELKANTFEQNIEKLNNIFNNQAQTAAQTYQGQIARLGIAFGELQESFGRGFIQALGDTTGKTNELMDAMKDAEDGIQQLGGTAADAVVGVVDLAGAFGRADAAVQEFGRRITSGFSLNLIALGNILGFVTDQEFAAAEADRDYFIQTGETSRAVVGQANAIQLQNRALIKLKAEYITANGALAGFANAQNLLEFEIGETSQAIINQFAALSRMDQNMQDAGTRALFVASADDTLRLAAQAAAAAVSGLSDSSGGASKDLFTFKEALAAVNDAGLEQLNANLKAAQEEFDGFRKSVAGGITGQLDFGSAIDEAKKGGTGIVEGIAGQAQGIVAFGEQLLSLLKVDLSEEAFLAVAQLSAERGSALATELLGANGATLIAQLNTSVAAVNAVADAVGLQSAEKFKGAGVATATATIDGFKEYMGKDGMGRARLMRVMDSLADDATRQARIDVVVTRSINEVVTRITQNIAGPQARAEGGPVRANRPYLVGEMGPELFTPSRSGMITPNSATGGNTYQITVQAGVGDPRAIGQQIVEYVKKFEKANGPVFAAA